MTASKNLSKVELRQRHNAAVKHGASGARRDLFAGQPFSNLAVEAYQKTLARWGHTEQELEQSGMLGDLVKETARHQTVADMCYMLTISAAAAGDLEQWERWVKLWRSISNRGLKHMQQLKDTLESDSTLDYELILHSPAEAQPK